MAVTVTNVLAGGAAPTAGVNTTASWTPDGTSQAILNVSSYVSTGSVVPAITSVTGNGLTWTQITTVNGDNTGADRSSQYMFVVPAGGSAGAITINWASAVPTKVSWTLDKVAGAASGLGSGTLPQAAVSGTSSGANPSATLANALQTNSVTYAAADFESSAGALSAGAGYTSLATDTSQSLAWIISEWNSAGSTTASATNSTVSNRHSIILIEIAVAASGSTQNADATLTATATISPDTSLTKPVDGGLTATAAVSPAASATKPVDAALTAAATITPAASATKPITASLTATATISAAATGTKPVDAALTGTATLTTAAASTKPVDASLAAAATITAAASVSSAGKNIDAAPAFTSTITAAAAGTKPVDAALTAAATLAAAAATTKPAQAALTALATITVDMTVGAITPGQLTPTSRSGTFTDTTAGGSHLPTSRGGVFATATAAAGQLTPTSSGGDT